MINNVTVYGELVAMENGDIYHINHSNINRGIKYVPYGKGVRGGHYRSTEAPTESSYSDEEIAWHMVMRHAEEYLLDWTKEYRELDTPKPIKKEATLIRIGIDVVYNDSPITTAIVEINMHNDLVAIQLEDALNPGMEQTGWRFVTGLVGNDYKNLRGKIGLSARLIAKHADKVYKLWKFNNETQGYFSREVKVMR